MSISCRKIALFNNIGSVNRVSGTLQHAVETERPFRSLGCLSHPASIPTRTLHTLRIAIKLLRLLAVLQSPFVQLASFGFDKRNLCLSGSNLGGFGPRHTAVANDK